MNTKKREQKEDEKKVKKDNVLSKLVEMNNWDESFKVKDEEEPLCSSNEDSTRPREEEAIDEIPKQAACDDNFNEGKCSFESDGSVHNMPRK